ncbi:MAG: DUF3276 family protein [Microbacter sp.]
MKTSTLLPNEKLNDQEIYYSKEIKAGKRIYYLDMKRSRFGDYYLAITESKKAVAEDDKKNPIVTFEKHKIFIYKEDFEKFLNGMQELIELINIKNNGLDAAK